MRGEARKDDELAGNGGVEEGKRGSKDGGTGMRDSISLRINVSGSKSSSKYY